jgi:hypothetical protein
MNPLHVLPDAALRKEQILQNAGLLTALNLPVRQGQMIVIALPAMEPGMLLQRKANHVRLPHHVPRRAGPRQTGLNNTEFSE